MYPFERFREDAKRALTFAGDEAVSAGYIGTEHVLIGLTRSDGPARDLLADFGLDAKTVRAAAASVQHTNPTGRLVPTSRVRTVLELAFKVSRQVSDGGVGGTELLLGILLEADGIGGHLLDEAGVTVETVCERLGLDAKRVRASGRTRAT